jgi:branched-chain amino acid transport system permease protein
MSAFFAGIGGALFAHELGTTLNPQELGFQKSIDIVIMVVLGGMGSITGVVFAATILTIMPELFREFSEYRMPIYALALIIVMIVRPQGLFGLKELWETQLWRRLFGKPGGKNGNGRHGSAGTPRAIARELGAASQPAVAPADNDGDKP